MTRSRNAVCLISLMAATAVFFSSSCAPEPPDSDGKSPPQPTTRTTDQQTPAFQPWPDGLRSRVDAAIKNVRDRDIRVTNSFWTVFHGILGLGPDVTLLDEKTGKRVN